MTSAAWIYVAHQRTSSLCNFCCKGTLNHNSNRNELDEVWNCGSCCVDCWSTPAAHSNLSKSPKKERNGEIWLLASWFSLRHSPNLSSASFCVSFLYQVTPCQSAGKQTMEKRDTSHLSRILWSVCTKDWERSHFYVFLLPIVFFFVAGLGDGGIEAQSIFTKEKMVSVKTVWSLWKKKKPNLFFLFTSNKSKKRNQNKTMPAWISVICVGIVCEISKLLCLCHFID